MSETTPKDSAENTAAENDRQLVEQYLAVIDPTAAEQESRANARVTTATPQPSDKLDFSIFRRQVGKFDGTEQSHEEIVKHNSLVQLTDRIFSKQLNGILKLNTREAQVGALMTYADKDLAPRHIVQVAQELSLRGAGNEVISFLDAQEAKSAENATRSFFASPEVKQWRATALQLAGRNDEAARLSEEILAEDGQEKNPEALRTRAMAEVARGATGQGRAGALAAFEEGFTKTGDYSLGMGALNAELERGNIEKARQLAPLVSLAAKNVGADQSKSFWPAVINAQAAIVGGDEAGKEQAVRHLAEVLGAKNENGTPVVSDDNRALALKRISQIVGAQPDRPEIEAMLRPLAEQLQGKAGSALPPPPKDVDETFSRRGYTSRQGMTPEGFHVRGNVRLGGMLPDSSTTLRDKMQFLEVSKTPLENFINSGLIKAEDLPPGADPKRSLYDIADVETRIKASQTVARGIFDVDGRNLEDLHGIDHKVYDSVVRLRIAHSGANSIGHLSDEDHETFLKIRDNPDRDLIKNVRNGQLTEPQLEELAKISPAFRENAAASKKLVADAELYRASDTRTNLAVAAGEGIGDCRHVAAATEALVSAVQQDKTAGLIRDAAARLGAGDAEGYKQLSAAADKELNGYEMRIYDQEVRAAVETKGVYEPIMTKDGKFVAAADPSKTQLIETHMHDVVRMTGENGGTKYVVADSFYQKGPYRMSWVENQNPEVTEVVVDKEKNTKMNMLKLSGGEIEVIVCKRGPDGKLIMEDGYPVPKMENGKVVMEKRPLELVSTKYSSPDRLEIGAPGPEDRLNGTSREPGRPLLAERLENPQRKADYVSQAKFIVDHPGKIETPELSKPEEVEKARGSVAKQEAALPKPKEIAPAASGPKSEPRPQPKAPVAETHAAASVEKPAPAKPAVEHAPVEHAAVEHASVEGVHSKIAGHAGTAQGVASVALDLAEGRYREAGQSAAIQVALNPGTYKAAAELTHDVAPVAKGLGFFAKKVPLLGAVVTAGFVAYEVGSNIHEGNYGKAAAALGAGTAEALGNVVGFGVGDAAREGVREGVVLAAGEKYAPEKSGLRQLGEGAYALAHKALEDHKQASEPHSHPTPAQPQRPSIYNYKNLPVVGFVLKDTPSAALNGPLQRTPDGFIKNLRDIDMSDPKNLRTFEDAINRGIRRNEQQIEAGKPKTEIGVVSSFLGLRSTDRKIEDAKVELRQLQGAMRELEMFKKEVAEHHGSAPATPQAGESKFHSGAQGKSADAPAAKETEPAKKPRQPVKSAPRL